MSVKKYVSEPLLNYTTRNVIIIRVLHVRLNMLLLICKLEYDQECSNYIPFLNLTNPTTC